MALEIGTYRGSSAVDRALRRIDELGIIGAGGGGFPTGIKLRAQVSTVIVNAAECEPLLHKDKELLLHQLEPFLRGLETVLTIVGAREGVIGIKEKYHEIIEVLKNRVSPSVRVAPLPDVYPAGDEFILVHLVTGRIIPPGGLPKDVDTVVANVETIVNIGLDQPVTHKYMTVAGAVANPMTVRVPVGISIGEVIEAAGGATISDFGILLGGVMMAKPAASVDVSVTKTTCGIIVLPSSHNLMGRHNAPLKLAQKIGRSACDQCRFCTEFCPRFLLGHPIQPHLAMQSLGFSSSADKMVAGTLYCCDCNLCTMFSCPEELDPKAICAQSKTLARERGLVFKGPADSVVAHPMADFRRVPMRRLIARLGLSEFKNIGPLIEHHFAPRRVKIQLQQSAGSAAVPVVKSGDRVLRGDLIANVEPGRLGACMHASIDGLVTLTAKEVVIDA
jgi:Na+-translocating ferredoxin:NAD+ oxidoreductase RnfC subunit